MVAFNDRAVCNSNDKFKRKLVNTFTAGLLHFVSLLFVQGLSMRQIRFRFDGQPINETDTPAQVNDRSKTRELCWEFAAGIDASVSYKILV